MKITLLLKAIIRSTVLKTINFIFVQLSDTPFLVYRVHMRAVEDSADYIEANMQRAMHFNFREDLWRYSFGQRRKTGLILEFGVWRGHSSRFFAERLSGDERLYGFDSFEGLQEDWAGNDRPKGYFSLGGRLPKVPRNVTLV